MQGIRSKNQENATKGGARFTRAPLSVYFALFFKQTPFIFADVSTYVKHLDLVCTIRPISFSIYRSTRRVVYARTRSPGLFLRPVPTALKSHRCIPTSRGAPAQSHLAASESTALQPSQ